ncbi:MARVEL domain-containing protein [Phanerochaete sordida]|uniref:MARVEL domain-containing protein n=1 Tax=Phanerochaete sordida TaxID=48140 RepID=A0A9P3G0R4_9APHY|nr:MARVEL domain-containing protein [Phanerochaete sordida]
MAFSDIVQSISARVMPEKRGSLPLQPSTTGVGIGSGGHVPFEDDMIVSKPAIIFFTCQIFFNFLAMCCFAGVASFQAKFKVGPSGLTGFALFISIFGMFYSLFLLLVPVIYEKYDKGARLARALKELRVGFILTTTGVVVSLLIAFITTISAWTEPGCKDAKSDPHAKEGGDDFVNGLPSWCATKKAGAVFFWLAFVFWLASLVLTILDWRSGKSIRPRDPPFVPPAEDALELDDEESLYDRPGKSDYEHSNSSGPFSDNNRYSGVPSATSYANAPQLPRQSFDNYGAFSDPAPSGFAPPAGSPPSFAPPLSPPPESPRISRTMQYADPYARVRDAVTQGPAVPAAPAYTSYNPYGP